MRQATFWERVRARAEEDMRELAREELAFRGSRGEAAAGEVDPEQLVDDVLEEMRPSVLPFLGERLAALLLRVRVLERIEDVTVHAWPG